MGLMFHKSQGLGSRVDYDKRELIAMERQGFWQ